MADNLVAKAATWHRAEPGHLYATTHTRRSADARICRIAGVGHSDTYTLVGIRIRGSADLKALGHIVAAHPQRSQIE